jgi:xanthine phosphoribosyltransferase
VIEKAFQPGHQLIVDMGVPVYSLARIKSLSENQVNFVEED